MMTLNAPSLRHSPENALSAFQAQKRFRINVVLDNLYDTFNIGSAFRLADSMNAQRVIICGKDSATPPNTKISKAAMKISEYMEWRHFNFLKECVVSFPGNWIVVEKTEISSDYRNWCRRIVNHAINNNRSINILVGNETSGVSEFGLALGKIVHIPMYGLNHSMNVVNALTIVGMEVANCYAESNS